jgi:hypothetical protein
LLEQYTLRLAATTNNCPHSLHELADIEEIKASMPSIALRSLAWISEIILPSFATSFLTIVISSVNPTHLHWIEQYFRLCFTARNSTLQVLQVWGFML